MKSLRAVFVAAFLAGGCSVHVPPVVTPPPVTAPRTVLMHTSIYDEAGAPVEDAASVLDLDVLPGAPAVHVVATGWRQTFIVTVPVEHLGWGASLTVTSPSYLTSSVRVTITPGEIPNPPVMKAVHAWGDEHGFLRTTGVRFVTEDGRDWRYRGYTAFTWLQKHCAGENIDPLVEDAVATGARVFRVLGMYHPWLGTFRLAVDNPPAYDACLLSFVRDLASHGLRVQFVVFADAQEVMASTSDQQRHFGRIATLLANEWNVLGELCNECPKNGVDWSAFVKPASRVLWSRGSGLGRGDPSAPPWDYSDYHEGRGDDYPRLNECRPYALDPNSPVRGVPCLQSEPMGASETDQPGKRAGAIGGDPSRAIVDFGQMGMNFGLQNAGGLFHSDAGLTGGPLGPVQRQMAVAFFRGLNFPPPEAQTWPYQRGDNCGNCDAIGGMPLQQLDAFELRIFCRGNGQVEYCDDIRAVRAPIPRAGWRIVESPAPGLLRLTR